ncbi:MAG: hypothetical protein ACI9OJ_001719 [Myxococcota bacterium]|jgi:hypothetical protein
MSNQLKLLVVFLLLGCASTLPPAKLVAVDAELSRPDARELAEAQPGPLRVANQHRDDAWKALRAGDAELAETHAWVAWLQLRAAENLEAGAQERAIASTRNSPLPPSSGSAGSDARPSVVGISPVSNRANSTPTVPGTPSDSVRQAEDAQLRLLAVGLTPDRRWAEAEALLQVAQRALDRGDGGRAEEMSRRAALVFEVIRITRLGDASFTPGQTSDTGNATAKNGSPALAGPRSTKAIASAFAQVVRHRVSAEQTGCTSELAEAEGFLKRAEGRRDAGDLAGSDAYVTAATAHLDRCSELEKEAVKTRVTPLRNEAEGRLKKATDSSERERLSSLIAQSDSAIARGDIAGAQSALLQTAGGGRQPAAKPGTTPTTVTGPVPGVAAVTQPSAPGLPAQGASVTGAQGAIGPAETAPNVVVVPGAGPTVGLAAPTATPSAGGDAKPSDKTPRPKSRIISNLLQPLDDAEP